MTKADLIERIATSLTETTGDRVSKKLAREILDTVVSVLRDELVQNQALSVSGFGHFRVSEREYTVFPGKPGEGTRDKSAATKVTRKNTSFRPAKALKVALNGDSAEGSVATVG